MVLDLAGLLRKLGDGKVRFVVIGGIAVAAHRVVRATEDVDVVPDPAHDNLDRLCEVLVALDAKLLRQPERGVDSEVRAALRRGRNLTVTTELGDLDVVQRLPGVPGFAELDARAWDAELAGARFRVCSREQLIAMKEARGAAIDKADLERLRDA
jgi:predicted nucleotidyltransferase